MRLALLGIPAVRSALSLEIGHKIEYHAALPSTQDRARALAAAGAAPCVVVADHQTAGQGTHGRCLLYTSPSPRDRQKSRMPSSA